MCFLLTHLDLDFTDSIVEFFCAAWWFCNLHFPVDLGAYVCNMGYFAGESEATQWCRDYVGIYCRDCIYSTS